MEDEEVDDPDEDELDEDAKEGDEDENAVVGGETYNEDENALSSPGDESSDPIIPSFLWVAESFDVSVVVGDVDEEGFASGGFAVAVAAEPAKNWLTVNQGIP